MVFPASNRLVASWISSQERGLANGLILAGLGADAGATPPLITFILLQYGWRWSFLICALLGGGAGLAWYLIARDRPEDRTWVMPAGSDSIRSGMPKHSAPENGQALPGRVIFGSRDVWALTISYFTFGYVSYVFFTWFFIDLNKVRGLDLNASTIFGMLRFLAMAAFSRLGATSAIASPKATDRAWAAAGSPGTAWQWPPASSSSRCRRRRRGWRASSWRGGAPTLYIFRRVPSGPSRPTSPADLLVRFLK